jgi:hypothetical protein
VPTAYCSTRYITSDQYLKMDSKNQVTKQKRGRALESADSAAVAVRTSRYKR